MSHHSLRTAPTSSVRDQAAAIRQRIYIDTNNSHRRHNHDRQERTTCLSNCVTRAIRTPRNTNSFASSPTATVQSRILPIRRPASQGPEGIEIKHLAREEGTTPRQARRPRNLSSLQRVHLRRGALRTSSLQMHTIYIAYCTRSNLDRRQSDIRVQQLL